ncbi:MAG: lipopolysaccharide kinase InaA family protein [Syntrophorhabdus sp.]
MKSYKINEVEWFIKDEGLIPVLQDIVIPEDSRRSYVNARYRGGQIFIKSFSEKGLPGFIRNKIASRGKREYSLGNWLLSRSIKTPEPLGYGISRMGSYIIQQWIEGESFLAAFKASGCRSELMAKLAALLKELKSHHVRHNDLHVENILVSGNELYLIDLHKMRIKGSFTVQDEVSNLSQVLADTYGYLDTDEKVTFFTNYGNPGIQETVEHALDRLADRWIRKKKERAFQETSMIVSRGNRFYRAGMENRATGELQSVLKADRKVKVERYTDHIRKMYVNRRRLERAWRNHMVLAYMNLSAAPTAFYVELPGDSLMGSITMEDLHGKGQELDRYLDGTYDVMDAHEKRQFIEKFSGFLLMITRKKIVHKDMKACNVFVLHDGGFMLLDVEDIRFRALDEEALKRMLIQLNTTIPGRIATSDRIRFFLQFTSPMKLNKRAIFKAVVRESTKREIVYEGVGGLKREEW